MQSKSQGHLAEVWQSNHKVAATMNPSRMSRYPTQPPCTTSPLNTVFAHHWSLHHTHLSASSLLIKTSSHLSSKVLWRKKPGKGWAGSQESQWCAANASNAEQRCWLIVVDSSGLLWKKAKAWALCLVYLRVWGTRFGLQDHYYYYYFNFK